LITLIQGAKANSLERIARSVAHVDGDAAECGVYQGGSLNLISYALPEKIVYGFDTFTGLPEESWSPDEVHQVGDFSDTSVLNVLSDVSHRPNVWLRVGVFPESAADLVHNKFAFVHIDFDFYLSTLDAINWFVPRMSKGGVMLFDDYRWPRCPGVQKAIMETGLLVHKTVDYQAIARF
jgi:O-methyltransferase